MKNKILLCCDLDRTVLPNGHAPESPTARKIFSQIVKDNDITLAYVSGRDKRLLLQAMDEYKIPVPDYAIGDVGTSMYRIMDNNWTELTSWSEHIAKDWHNITSSQIKEYLSGLDELTLQEDEKQNRFKISYYAPANVNAADLKQSIKDILVKHKISANLIWSVDEIKNIGLLDILPVSANKLHAIEFLIAETGIEKFQTVFAGDSGNDLPVIISDIPAVLVNNASNTVKQEAMTIIADNGNSDFIYIASGDFKGLNGNYSAGILEGLVHYHPRFSSLIK